MLKNSIVKICIIALLLVIGNWVFSSLYFRWDITSDKRYTLSETTNNALAEVAAPLYIDVLLKGDFPSEFKKLQFEVKQLLEQYETENSLIIFNFVNPLEGEENPDQVIQSLNNMGLPPTNIPITENGRKSITQIFPWAVANYGKKSVRIPLLINNFGNDAEENIAKSVQQLEYNFTDAIVKLSAIKDKKVAILKGNNELGDKYMSDFLVNLKEYYRLGKFNLDSLKDDPEKTLKNLSRFDAAIIAKPTEAFTDTEKLILDQYIMQGGKVLWALDQVSMDLDSLQNEAQRTVSFPRKLNLEDMLFKYGVRVNYNLVEDLTSTPITVQGSNGPMPIDWLYSPIAISPENHSINKNVNVVKLEFANQIDTLENGIKKTVLLESSKTSRAIGVPKEIFLEQFMNNLNPELYNKGPLTLGVLLEGQFTSGFKNRVKPVKLSKTLDQSTTDGKMIVIGDGDIFNYTYANKKPLTNGLDPWTQQIYGNKDFLVNCMNYLLNDTGLINIRGKEIKLAFLDHEKVTAEQSKWKLINIGVPAILLTIFGFVFFMVRRKKYTK